MLLHRGSGQVQLLHVGGHVDGPDVGQLRQAVVLAPGQEAGDGAIVGFPGMGVADGGGEEIDEAPGGALPGPEHRGRQGWGSLDRGPAVPDGVIAPVTIAHLRGPVPGLS